MCAILGGFTPGRFPPRRRPEFATRGGRAAFGLLTDKQAAGERRGRSCPDRAIADKLFNGHVFLVRFSSQRICRCRFSARRPCSRGVHAAAVAGLRRCGTGSIFCTLVTAPIDKLGARRLLVKARLRARFGGRGDDRRISSGRPLAVAGARVLRRASAGGMRAPSVADWERLQAAAGGRIRLVTIAPVNGRVRRNLSPAWCAKAFTFRWVIPTPMKRRSTRRLPPARVLPLIWGMGARRSCRGTTISFSACWRATNFTACLIPDGIHLPPFVLKKPVSGEAAGARCCSQRIAWRGAGAPPGRYTIGEMTVEIGADRVVRQPGGSGFAGFGPEPPMRGGARGAVYLNLSRQESEALVDDSRGPRCGSA